MTLVFFDTNIVLYPIDARNAEKASLAEALIVRHQRAGEAVISTQVLQETYNNGVKKFGLSPDAVEAYVRELVATLRVVGSTSQLVLDAINVARRSQLQIYDALMIAAARQAGCATLYTEDLNHTQIISGVQVINPFKSPAKETAP